jgi:hypothetical protein
MPHPPCPYCGTDLPREPQRGGKCPHCGERFQVRSKQSLFPSPILTEKQANAVESFKDLQEYGVIESDYHEERDRRVREHETEPLPGDVIWALWHSVLLQLADQPDRASRAYRSMAKSLWQEGKNASHVLRASALAELTALEQRGVTHVAVSAVTDDRTCEVCKAAAERGRVTLAEAREHVLVPNPDCTSGWCRCVYLLHKDREAPATEAPHATPGDAVPEKSGCVVVLLAVTALAGLVGTLLTA